MIINVLDLIWLFYLQFYLVINVEVTIIQVCAPESKTRSNSDNAAFPVSSVELLPLGRLLQATFQEVRKGSDLGDSGLYRVSLKLRG